GAKCKLKEIENYGYKYKMNFVIPVALQILFFQRTKTLPVTSKNLTGHYCKIFLFKGFIDTKFFSENTNSSAKGNLGHPPILPF
ncbi:MAG: hypothetical protein KAT52_05270, partial [Desulfobacterales bacterium]|nr:hypothetical protein [Desulfobacterales bacterium]